MSNAPALTDAAMPRLRKAAGASPVPYPIGDHVTDLAPRQPDTTPAAYHAATFGLPADRRRS